jgi:hypothetical protein
MNGSDLQSRPLRSDVTQIYNIGNIAQEQPVAEVRETVVVRREPLIDKLCPICSRPFQAVNRRRYCSATCLNRAAYLRHAEQRRANRREAYRRQQEGRERPK